MVAHMGKRGCVVAGSPTVWAGVGTPPQDSNQSFFSQLLREYPQMQNTEAFILYLAAAKILH